MQISYATFQLVVIWIIGTLPIMSLCLASSESNPIMSETTKAPDLVEFDGLRKKLALLLFDEVPGTNLVVSPLLLRLQLCKLSPAALDPARKQLLAVLGWRLNKNVCQESVLPLLQNFDAFDSMWLNAIFINDTDIVRDLFITNSTMEYGVDVIKVGFNLPQASRSYINRWVSTLSLRRIPSIIDPDDITNDTAMVMASAAYLKTFWYSAFKLQDTTNWSYWGTKNKAINVQMMHQIAHVPFFHDKTLKLKIVDIDMAIPEMYMTVIVPDEKDGLPKILKHMSNDSDYVGNLRKQMQFKDIKLSIPKFVIKTYVGWQGFLEQIGVVDIFNSSSNSLTIIRKDGKNTKIDHVKQHIFLQVEESFQAMPPGYQKTKDNYPFVEKWDGVVADRPFYFSFNFLIGNDHVNHEDFLVGVYYGP